MDPSTSAVPRPVTRADIAAWVLAAIALALIIKLHLLSSLLAGLLVFKLVDVLTPWLRVRALGRDGPRVLAVTLIATAVIAALVGIGVGIAAFLRNSDESVPLLMQRMAQIVEDARAILPEGLRRYIPANTETLQGSIAEWLRSNASSLQLAGRGIGRTLVHVLMGMIIGALLSMQKASNPIDRRPLTEQVARHAARMASVFQRVVFAQVWISLINTFFTWLYLDIVLSLFGVDLPLVKTLVALTFIVGLLPIIGNLISNTAIVIVCLSQGVPVAAASLVFLVADPQARVFPQCAHHRLAHQRARLGAVDRHAGDGSGVRHSRPDRRAYLLRVLQGRVAGERTSSERLAFGGASNSVSSSDRWRADRLSILMAARGVQFTQFAGENTNCAAPLFDSTCRNFVVPGIGTIQGFLPAAATQRQLRRGDLPSRRPGLHMIARVPRSLSRPRRRAARRRCPVVVKRVFSSMVP